jgi:hypothetical protein
LKTTQVSPTNMAALVEVFRFRMIQMLINLKLPLRLATLIRCRRIQRSCLESEVLTLPVTVTVLKACGQEKIVVDGAK